MTDNDCCNKDYILGFFLGLILYIFAPIALCYESKSGFKLGVVHAFIIMSVLTLIAIIILIILNGVLWKKD